MTTKDWNPDLYLKFNKERIQPTIDLVSRIDMERPAHIIDIGCGPGNSTHILGQRWPDSRLLGIDNSEAMIEKARHDYPDLNWQLLDAGRDRIPGRYDLVFSNATIQWIPDHPGLFRKLKAILSDQGVLAIQLPLFFEMPLGISIANISRIKRWSRLTDRVNDLFTIHKPSEYYDMLSPLFDSIELWVTDYVHIMVSHHAILEMIRSTGLRPYLDRLETEDDRNDFEAMVLADITRDYPLQQNGKALFPFKRLFFLARMNK